MSWVRDPDIGWFYVVGKQQMGPVKLAGLVELYTKGKAGGGIGEESLIWSDKMSGWEKLKNFAPLLQILQERRDAAPKPKPPPPGRRAPPAAARTPRPRPRGQGDKRGRRARRRTRSTGRQGLPDGLAAEAAGPAQLVGAASCATTRRGPQGGLDGAAVGADRLFWRRPAAPAAAARHGERDPGRRRRAHGAAAVQRRRRWHPKRGHLPRPRRLVRDAGNARADQRRRRRAPGRRHLPERALGRGLAQDVLPRAPRAPPHLRAVRRFHPMLGRAGDVHRPDLPHARRRSEPAARPAAARPPRPPPPPRAVPQGGDEARRDVQDDRRQLRRRLRPQPPPPSGGDARAPRRHRPHRQPPRRHDRRPRGHLRPRAAARAPAPPSGMRAPPPPAAAPSRRRRDRRRSRADVPRGLRAASGPAGGPAVRIAAELPRARAAAPAAPVYASQPSTSCRRTPP